ncbi:hypothetical protein GCM10023321_71330 [Pseudonocardia eucalypti]|uniref:DUF3040 domain-containing protein n=1 Tax=Pseudonocardia eucalypti TaxID=648755 RepID=A0ABP9R685_9PSEU
MIPGGPRRDGHRSAHLEHPGVPEGRESGQCHQLHPSILPAQGEDAHERTAVIRRRQTLGFAALVLVLAATVTLAAIGQPWVAGLVATTGLGATVATFVTGKYQPPRIHIPKVAQRYVRRPPQG